MKKKLLLPAVAALALLTALPALAAAKAGELDLSFAGTGKKTVFLEARQPGRPAPQVHLAWASRGKIVVAAGRTVAQFLPSGRPDRSFGDRGRLRVEPAPGSDVELAGVAIDSRGRIVVAGTARSSQWSAAGFVARYLADGRPDPRFGSGGAVLTTLGLPAPPKPPNPHPLQPVPPIEGPFVQFLGLAVDAADRPVVSGAWASSFRLCYPSLYYTAIDTGILARLGENGALDPSFGNGGVLTDPDSEVNLSPLPNDGGTLYLATQTHCIRGGVPGFGLQRASDNGQPDPGFGAAGQVSLPQADSAALARDRFGRIFTFAVLAEFDGSILQRLTRRGTPDPRFGKGGSVRARHEWATKSAALAVDRRGRPVVAAGLQSAGDRAGFIVVRRRGDGRLDHSFGNHGEAITYFAADANPEQVLTGGDSKIVVGGTVSRPDSYRIALVRYSAR